MKQKELWRVNSFTSHKFSGNPAGVVPAADGLSDELMLKIAGELNDISETAFVLHRHDSEADLQFRYFTSTVEVDLCGHATVAALFTLGWSGYLKGRDSVEKIRVRTRAGVLPLELSFGGEVPEWATMEQMVPKVARAPGEKAATEILGISPDAIDPELGIACASTGIWACFVALKDVAELARLKPDRSRIGELWPDNPGLTGVYAFAFLDESTVQGRFFVPPRFGIVEDPVTGTACGALGGFLQSRGRFPEGGVLEVRQGIEMGRPGRVRVSPGSGGRMRISGQAVPIFRGELFDTGSTIL